MTPLKIINILGGPGVGKSVCAHDLFAKLKRLNICSEYVGEYAKDLTYEERFDTLKNDQIYIFGKQQHRMHVLRGKVDWVVTDTSILLGMIYGDRDAHYVKNLDGLILDVFKTDWNFNFVLTRDPSMFQQYGRNHTLDQSKKLDEQIIDVLQSNKLQYTVVEAGDNAPDAILNHLHLNDKPVQPPQHS